MYSEDKGDDVTEHGTVCDKGVAHTEAEKSEGGVSRPFPL